MPKLKKTLSLASVTRLDAIGGYVSRAIDSVMGSAVGRVMDSAMGKVIGRSMFSSAPFVRIGAMSGTRLDAKVKLTFLFTSVTRLDSIGRAMLSSVPFVRIVLFCFSFTRRTI